MVDLRSCMHTISLSYCRTSFILVVACIACGILPLSEISIRASAHSWLGFVFPSTERRSSDGACPGSYWPKGLLAWSQGPWGPRRSQGPRWTLIPLPVRLGASRWPSPFGSCPFVLIQFYSFGCMYSVMSDSWHVYGCIILLYAVERVTCCIYCQYFQ